MALIRRLFIGFLPRVSAAAMLLMSIILSTGFQSQTAARPTQPPQQPPVTAATNSTATVSSASRIEPPTPAYRYPDGQTFTYNVDWRLLNAGRTTLRLDTVNGERHILVTADSTGAVALLYHVHDRLETFFNPQTNCALALTKHTEEGFRRVDTRVRYDNSRKKAVLDERNQRAKNEKHEENELSGCVTNTVAAAYYVASLALQPGAKFSFPSSDGGQAADIAVTVEARENMKTPAGKYDTLRLSAEALSGPQKGKGTVWMWYTDDARRIPVQMRARAFWGTLTFRLSQISGTTQPASSQ